jgi:hypothetical protein
MSKQLHLHSDRVSDMTGEFLSWLPLLITMGLAIPVAWNLAVWISRRNDAFAAR